MVVRKASRMSQVKRADRRPPEEHWKCSPSEMCPRLATLSTHLLEGREHMPEARPAWLRVLPTSYVILGKIFDPSEPLFSPL